jgi:hypothetical protein
MPMALIVGDYVPGDPIVDAFRATAVSLGYELQEAPYKAAPDILPEPRCKHLVLFCISRTVASPSDLLELLRPCGKRTIAYVETSKASPEEAIRYSHEGLADGYVVGDGKGQEESIEGFCDLVRKLHLGLRAYTRIKFRRDAEERPMAFISTPFDRDNRAVMQHAVDSALSRLGFDIEWSDNDYRLTVHDGIREMIRKSSILIANISLDQRYLNHNANVYFEAGIAAAHKERPIVFVRRTRENDVALPADIQGRRWLTYDNEIELAKKLYHGLKPDGL